MTIEVYFEEEIYSCINITKEKKDMICEQYNVKYFHCIPKKYNNINGWLRYYHHRQLHISYPVRY